MRHRGTSISIEETINIAGEQKRSILPYWLNINYDDSAVDPPSSIIFWI